MMCMKGKRTKVHPNAHNFDLNMSIS